MGQGSSNSIIRVADFSPELYELWIKARDESQKLPNLYAQFLWIHTQELKKACDAQKVYGHPHSEVPNNIDQIPIPESTVMRPFEK